MRGNARRTGRRQRWAIGGVSATVVVVALAVLASWAAASSARHTARSLTTLKLVLAWYPTPEYGGLYAGLHEGYFKAAGINLVVREGGPQVSATQVVGSGQADIGYLNNDETLMLARQNGIPLTEFATTYQVYPEGVEYHSSHPISSFAGISGKTIATVTGSADYLWLKTKYHLKNTVTPYSYATFAHDAKSLLLGYAPDDVPTLAAQGIKIGYLLVSKSGLDPYADVLFAKQSYVAANKQLLESFLTALGKGWQFYRTHEHLIDKDIYKADNTTPLKTDDAIAKVQDSFIYSGQAATKGIGYIDPARVKRTYEALKKLKVLKTNLNLSQVVAAGMVPKLLPPKK